MSNDTDQLRDDVGRVAVAAIAAGGRILGLTDQHVVETVIRGYYRTLPETGARHLVDVGAAYGGVAEVFLKDGWTADLFEPDPACQRVLQRLVTAYGSRARLVPFAADAQDREAATFVLNATPGLSGLAPSPFGATRDTVAIRTVRLDTFLAANAASRVDFLKIDTEGNDFAVLETHDFHRWPPALAYVEFSYFFAGQNAAVLRGAVATMGERGYCPVIFEYDDDGNFRRGNWHHRLVAVHLDDAAIPQRPEAFGNILFYRKDDQHFLATLGGVIRALV
jgi:FkbM family methyltransferase